MYEALHNESLAEKFIKRGGWLYFFTLLIGPLGYGIKIILSHDLSVSDIGLMYGVLSFITLLGGFNDFGMIESLNYFIPKLLGKNEEWKAKAYIIYAFGIMLLASIILVSFLFFGAHLVATYYFQIEEAAYLLRVFAVFLLLSNILHFFSTIFSIFQDTKLLKGIEALRMFLTFTFVLVLFFSQNNSLDWYSWTWNISIVFTLIFAAYMAWKKYLWSIFHTHVAHFSTPHLKEIVSYGLWSVLTANVGILLSQIDMQLLLVLRWTEETGYYTNYLSLLSIPFIFTSPIIGFLFPVISGYIGKNDIKKVQTIIATFSKYFAIIGIMWTVLIFLFGHEVGSILFGEKFQRSGTILLYSGPFMIFNLLLQINFQLLAWMGAVKKRLHILLVGLTINCILNLILIPKFWAEWSAFAVGVSWIPLWYLSARETKKFHENFQFKNFLYNALASCALGIIIYPFLQMGFSELSKTLMILVMLGVSMLFGILFLILNKTDTKLLFQTIKNR